MIPAALFYATCALMWLVSSAAVVALVHARRVTLREAELTQWAQSTMFCVTDRHGLIRTLTMSELYRDPAVTERVWVTPIAVSFFRYGPGMTCAAHPDHQEDRA